MRGCLSLEKNTRPTFRDIVKELQLKSKGAGVAKKNNSGANSALKGR